MSNENIKMAPLGVNSDSDKASKGEGTTVKVCGTHNPQIPLGMSTCKNPNHDEHMKPSVCEQMARDANQEAYESSKKGQ